MMENYVTYDKQSLSYRHSIFNILKIGCHMRIFNVDSQMPYDSIKNVQSISFYSLKMKKRKSVSFDL